MTQQKKKPPQPLKGEYRTLRVPVDRVEKASAAAPPLIAEDIRVPETMKSQMARLDLTDLDTDDDARRRETAVAETAAQQTLVDYFEGRSVLTEALIDVYLEETRNAQSNDMLILRYHHQGNRPLEQLITACIARDPTNKGLLYDLAHLSRFIGQTLPVIDHYCRALIMESAWPRLRALADDICDHGHLRTPASRSRFQELLRDHPEKWQLVDNTMARHG
ncbi:MAG: hypothetical protein ABIL58_08010 [Pseudomonadota bacterium]